MQDNRLEAVSHPYWLYHFLRDLEDILTTVADDRPRLQAICPLVSELLNNSPLLQLATLEPDPNTGWEVLILYDEPLFPLTVQLVSWAPGAMSSIHNHGTWGIVALMDGQEENTFWQRSPTPACPDRVVPAGKHRLVAGDILCLMPDVIHQVTAIGGRPTLSFNLYGETDYDQRFEFDPVGGTAKPF